MQDGAFVFPRALPGVALLAPVVAIPVFVPVLVPVLVPAGSLTLRLDLLRRHLGAHEVFEHIRPAIARVLLFSLCLLVLCFFRLLFFDELVELIHLLLDLVK